MMKSARAAGVLFLVSTGAYMLGSGLLDPVLHRPDFLAGLYPDRTNAMAGALLEFVNAMTVAGIAMLLYPDLKKHNEVFALGYFGARMMEAVLLMLSACGPLALLALSRDYIAAGAAKAASFETIGNAVLDAQDLLFQAAMIVLGLGSLLLCRVLYRSRLVPRFLAAIGFVGYAALLASACLAILGQNAGPVLYVPGALFEIAFPVWLLVKGLNPRREEPN